MSNASLKEQLQAVASKISEKNGGSKKNEKQSSNSHQKNKKDAKTPSKWLSYVHYGVELLMAYFPDCFQTKKLVKPLKKGIKQDLLRRLSTMSEIAIEDKACMIKSLAYYVNTYYYHQCIIEGAKRINLDGHPQETVTAEEAQYSLLRREAKMKSKKPASPINQTKAEEIVI